MKHGALSVAVLCAGMLVIAGCGKAKPHVSATASTAVKADEAREQQLMNKCLQHGTLLTKNGRKAFFTCASGGMTPASFETCATRQLSSTSLLTKAGRSRWMLRVTENCVVTK